MVLRTVQEIDSKIAELSANASGTVKSISKKHYLFGLLITAFIAVVLLWAVYSAQQEYACGIIVVPLLALVYMFFEIFFFGPERRRLRTAEHRELLAKYLAEGREIIREKGEQGFYDALDRLIVESRTEDESEIDDLDVIVPEHKKAKIEAYSWIATRDIRKDEVEEA